MDNPRYEHNNGQQQNSTVINGNLQLNYDSVNNDAVCKYHTPTILSYLN